VKDELQDLKVRLEQLVARKNDTYKKLTIVQQNMATGIISGSQLAPELKELHEQYEAMRKDMLLRVPPEFLAAKYPEGSLKELEDWLKAIETRDLAHYTKAKDVLKKIARLTHRDPKQKHLLQPCHEDAFEIAAQIAESSNEAVLQKLASGHHPLARLLHLVINHETMPDKEVETIEATITKSYGRSLALAAVMGRLFLGANPPEVSSHPDADVASALLECAPVEEIETALPSSAVEVATAMEVDFQRAELDLDLNDESENREPACNEGAEEASEELQGEQLISDEVVENPLEPAGQHELEQRVSTPEGAATLELVWQFLNRGDIPYAYYAALEDNALKDLIQALLIGKHIRHGRGELAFALTSLFYKIGGQKKPWEQCIIAATALMPALLAPETNARDILGALCLPEPLANVQTACQAIAELGNSAVGQVFFGKALDSAEWKKEARSLKEEALNWKTAALQASFSFIPANRVWRRWVEPGGRLASLLDLVGEDTPWSKEVQDLVESFVNENKFRRLVDDTDRKQLGRRVGEDILARQMKQMMTRSRQAIQLLNRWFELMRIKPQASAASNQSAKRVNTVLVAKRQDLLAQIAEARIATADPYFRISLDVLSRSLDDACEYLLGLKSTDEEIDLNVVMNKELLRLPAVALNEDWTIQVRPDDLVNQLVYIDTSKPWVDVFEERCRQGDHIATKLILDLLSHIGGDHQANAALIAKREKALRDAREALRNDTALTSKQVENALASGWLREGERALLSSRVAAIQATLEDALTFVDKHGILNEIRTGIKEKQYNQLDDVHRRLKDSSIDPESISYARIASAISEGNALTANEYIDLVLRGEDLPNITRSSKKFIDFVDKLPVLARYIQDPRSRVSEMLKRQKNFASLDISQVPGSRLKLAAAVWEQWSRTSEQRFATDAAVKVFFSGLGFDVKSVTRPQNNGSHWYDIQTAPLRNRNQCPIPWYGSIADGNYRVLCVYQKPTEEWMVNVVDDAHKANATIVLHFGVFSEKRRRDLARLCRKRRKTVLVLDDCMLLYLCAERGERLPVFFECALPYTYCEPYTTTAGIIPPEMFYGRDRERRSIIDPMGSCFIFGGRQLGKTVLLREVVREFHQPTEGRVGIWIDLKGEGVGVDRPVDHVWRVIANEAKRSNILPDDYDPGLGSDQLAEALMSWLEKESKRRILLLLDEADRFLEIESQGDGRCGEFSRVARLKALMDRTERRLKVVLAGLHNVQRTTRLSNHPLAHYGDPLCIGPLMDNGEWREAKALIERPMAALGYQFEEGKDLVTLIMSQTNYYPSLIQLYCHHLLHHVTASIANSPEQPSGPPYTITERHVIEVYQNHELRRAIRERFLLTLGLDERFRVIAYIMAHYSRSDSTQRHINGFPVSWVRDKATTWWPKGFYSSSDEDSFRAMLDEMVGLGVLTVISPGKYALRNPNIISLLGSDEEIVAELANIEKESTPEYTASNHRAPLRQGTEVIKNRRSPLTVQQEAMLCDGVAGVTVLFGSNALGLDELPEFLLRSRDDLSITIIDQVDSRTQAMSDVSNAYKTATKNKCLVLVMPNCNWTYRWVEEACKVVNNKGKNGKVLRVLFLADPKSTFQFAQVSEASLQSLDIEVQTLKLWHESELRRWLEDCDFSFVGSEMRAKLQAMTGCWPNLIREFWQLASVRQKDKEMALTDLNAKLVTRDFALAIINSMGIELGRPYAQLLKLMSYLGGEVSTQDLSELLRNEGVSEESIKASIKGAERLSLIRHGKESGGWEVEPVVDAILKVASQHDQ